MQKHKVPFKVKLYRLKNTGFVSLADKLINKVYPAKKCDDLPGEILFNRNDKIGDAMVTIPVLRDLKLNYPSVIIDVLCSETNCFLFKELEFINKLHVYNKDSLPELENRLKAEKYQAIVDLVSTDKKLIRMFKRCAPFVAGSRMFGFSWLYDYYLQTNWVSEYDTEPISMKIEYLLNVCFGFKFNKRDKSMPYFKPRKSTFEKEYDILFHLGTGKIRKLDPETEEKLIDMLIKYRVLITDGTESARYAMYKTKFSDLKNFSFKLYQNIEKIVPDALKSKLVLCYDGGQAHYLGQYNKCIIMVGSVSPLQWSPYDFSVYSIHKIWGTGVKAYISGGIKKHVALNYPTWCSPCFNIGCSTRPCINNIQPENVFEIIENNLNI